MGVSTVFRIHMQLVLMAQPVRLRMVVMYGVHWNRLTPNASILFH